jgi:tRNA A-37 threonylcarbamoyl transferase component Bud32
MNSYSLSDRECLWSLSLNSLGIESATLLSESPHDSARRTYVYKDRVYKIVLLRHERTKALRAQTLVGEFNIVKQCADIPGVPKAIDYRRLDDIEAVVFEFVPGSPLSQVRLGLLRSCAILGQLLFILLRISLRGVSHNDVLPTNILVSADGRVFLIDFDQAVESPRIEALVSNLTGKGVKMARGHGSFASIVKRQLSQLLPPSVVRLFKCTINRGKIPKISGTANPRLEALRAAWELAQVSDANSPGQVIAYYSLDFDGYHFPGERPWIYRWRVLKGITEFQGKRVLELGCNLSLLSCYLLKEAGADAALAVDADATILAAAQKAASAFGVQPVYKQVNFDEARDWETDLLDFGPDIVFALSVLNWVKNKERFLSFLGKFPEVIFEGHESVEVETQRFHDAGFDKIALVAMSERSRPILHCQKRITSS